MSVSLNLVAVIAPDEYFTRMSVAWHALVAAGLPITDELNVFFGYHEPDPVGRVIHIETTAWADRFGEGYECAIADLPAHVTHIRAFLSA